jgi:hypothetical protein
MTHVEWLSPCAATLAFAFAASACAGHDTTNANAEAQDRKRDAVEVCGEGGSLVSSSAERTSLGFSAAEVMQSVGAEHVLPVSMRCAPDRSCDFADQTLAVQVKARAGAICIRLDCSERPPGNEALPPAERKKYCPETLYVPATITLKTDQGTLKEPIDVELRATTAGQAKAVLHKPLALSALDARLNRQGASAAYLAGTIVLTRSAPEGHLALMSDTRSGEGSTARTELELSWPGQR